MAPFYLPELWVGPSERPSQSSPAGGREVGDDLRPQTEFLGRGEGWDPRGLGTQSTGPGRGAEPGSGQRPRKEVQWQWVNDFLLFDVIRMVLNPIWINGILATSM